MAKFTVQIEREILVSVQAGTPEQAEEEAMAKFIANPNEELLLNKVVSVTEEEE